MKTKAGFLKRSKKILIRLTIRKKKARIENTRKEKENIIADPTVIKKITKEYYEKVYARIFENLRMKLYQFSIICDGK